MEFKLPYALDTNKMSQTIDSETKAYIRTSSTIREEVGVAISTLYNQSSKVKKQTMLVSSGTQAIYMVLKTLATLNDKEPCCILASDEVYSCTRGKVFRSLAKDFSHLTIQYFDVSKKGALEASVTKSESKRIIVYVESCTNPNGKIPDFAALRDLHKQHPNIVIVVDNTWLSPAVFDPFAWGAWIVIESCSKYLSNCKTIMGCVTFAEPLCSDVFIREFGNTLRVLGIHVPDRTCQVLAEGTETLESRIAASYLRVLQLLPILAEHCDIVRHPSINSLAKSLFAKDLGPSVIAFHIPWTKMKTLNNKQWKRQLEELLEKHSILYITSFGHSVDSIDCYPHSDKAGLWLRLAVGYTPNDEFIAKTLAMFCQAL